MSREEWLKDRLNGIGGSEASVVMGINPWKSKLELYTEKVTGNVKEIDTQDTKWGKILEPVIIKEYVSITGKQVIMNETYVNMKSPCHEFMTANPDGIIIDESRIEEMRKGILECKTKGAFINWGDEIVPLYYIIQMQHYLYVTGFYWGAFAIFDFGKKDLIIHNVIRDDKLIETLIEEERKFWELVQKKIPPKVDESPACNDFLRKMYPESVKGKILDLTNDNEAKKFALQLKVIREENKSLDKLELESKNYLMSVMGDNEKAIGDGFSITWKRPKDKIMFDIKKFKEEHFELCKKYTSEEMQSRRFIVKFNDEKEKDGVGLE